MNEDIKAIQDIFIVSVALLTVVGILMYIGVIG
jgi:hypothetical protein